MWYRFENSSGCFEIQRMSSYFEIAHSSSRGDQYTGASRRNRAYTSCGYDMNHADSISRTWSSRTAVMRAPVRRARCEKADSE